MKKQQLDTIVQEFASSTEAALLENEGTYRLSWSRKAEPGCDEMGVSIVLEQNRKSVTAHVETWYHRYEQNAQGLDVCTYGNHKSDEYRVPVNALPQTLAFLKGEGEATPLCSIPPAGYSYLSKAE